MAASAARGEKPARAIYQAVRQSPLFDTALQMYKLNECLDACPPEIGRARTFTRGWFENESIWTHMSYKYLLELLRSGLYDEFFADTRTMLVPFMDPAVYGRSVLENSSFIASSANPDPHTRGRGFIARLSGSTAEFIHMWLLLTVGPQPFFMEQGRLHFRVRPTLPGGWFTQHDTTFRWQEADVDISAGSFAWRCLGPRCWSTTTPRAGTRSAHRRLRRGAMSWTAWSRSTATRSMNSSRRAFATASTAASMSTWREREPRPVSP